MLTDVSMRVVHLITVPSNVPERLTGMHHYSMEAARFNFGHSLCSHLPEQPSF
jgi:hypothetical protein